MLKRRIIPLLIAGTMTVGLLAGCSQQAEETPVPTEVSTSTEEPQATETPELVETVEPAASEEPQVPDNISPTTGLEDTTTTYKPIIVQIDNEPTGRPQRGTQMADVVYETLIEGIDTRLTCVFNDVIWSDESDDRLKVGPVRSSRYYHQWIQGEWDALYTHMGGAENVNNPESDIWGASADHIKERINGAGKKASHSDLFYAFKDGQSVSNFAAVNLKDAAEVYDYEPTVREPFKFYPLEDYANEKQIDTIALSFLSSSGWVSYEYDADKDKLIRYMNGKEFIAQETGDPVEVQNLIVQYVAAQVMPNDAGDRKKIDVFGEGPAEFIIHGKHLKGTWKREGESDSTKYYLENGEEVTLTPGNTWIEMHPNTKPVIINYEDGSEYSVNT